MTEIRIKVSFFLFVTLILCVNVLCAQNKDVKWIEVNGKDNEFSLFIPEGYFTTSGSDFYLGQISQGAHVNNTIRAIKYINGVVLKMEYYEGDSKKIQKILFEQEKLTAQSSKEINGFQVWQFPVKKEKILEKTQIFQTKNALYVMKAICKADDDKIANGFFESIRLVNKNNIVAPNVPQNAKAINLPRLVEQEPQRIDDSQVFEPKDVNRNIIILSVPRPDFSFETRQGIGSFKLKLKILYSSSGKVSNVEVIGSASKLVSNAAIESVKRTTFIPAEKDGKLVSVYKIQEYGFDTKSF